MNTINITRRIEKFNRFNGKWESISFQYLVEGDIFRIFDDNERYVNKTDGNNIWIALDDPYLDDNKVWTINTLY